MRASLVKNISILSTWCILWSCSSPPSSPQQRSYPVTIAEVTVDDVPIYIEAIGNVSSLQVVNIRPQVGGMIQEAYIKQGQYTKKGDILYKIDPRPYQAALDKAKATLLKNKAALKYAELQEKRNAELVQKDYIAKLTYEQYVSQVEINKAQVQSDQADVMTAELNLSWSSPISPIDGRTSQYNVDPGNLVIADDPNALITIMQMDPIGVRFSITQSEFIRVQQAMRENSLKFEISLPQLEEQAREGHIYFINNHLDPATGSILLKGKVPNADEMFWPGEFVKIKLQLKTDSQALLVPEEALRIGQNGPYLYLFQPETSTVEYREVVKGERLNGKIAIKQGVQLEDKVIVKGQNNLQTGTKVYLSEASTEIVPFNTNEKKIN